MINIYLMMKILVIEVPNFVDNPIQVPILVDAKKIKMQNNNFIWLI